MMTLNRQTITRAICALRTVQREAALRGANTATSRNKPIVTVHLKGQITKLFH